MVFKRKEPSRKIPINRYPFTLATYPGRRPLFSFFFTSKGIYCLKFRALRCLLKEHGLPFLTSAMPSSPTAQTTAHKNLTDVAVLYGRLKGAEAVYAEERRRRGMCPQLLLENQ